MTLNEGSLSSSSHDSMGELAPTEAELSELEQRKVVVLGVPWQTSDMTLQQHFGQFGLVEEAQIMREKYTGKSRGFGFVTFRSTTDALQAVNAEHSIDGRKCEAKFALPEGKVGSARTTRIFVARIPSSVSDAQFRQYFEQFGVCQDCYMPKDPSKQGHRGIGFVTYSSPESVELVMSQTHVLNGNEIAIDRATPKEKTALLPGRLSMSQPNLQLAGGGGSSHGILHFNLMQRHPLSAASPPSLNSGLLMGMGGRQMSHPVLPMGTAGMLGSPPGPQSQLQGNGGNNGSYHGGGNIGSYHGGGNSGSYHGGGNNGSYHGGGNSGSYHGGGNSGSFHGGGNSGSYAGGGNSGSYPGTGSFQQSAGSSYHGGQSAGGSYHGGSQQYGGGGDATYGGGQGTGSYSGGGGQGNSSYGVQGAGGYSTSLGSLASFGSASMNINLLSQAQAAALQQQLSGGGSLTSLDASSPSQLINLLSANTAVAAAAGGAGMGRYGGQAGGSTASSQSDLSGLLGQQAEQCVHGGWLRSTLSSGSLGGGGSGSSAAGNGALGPASARAGPRIFIGKLNKETSEQDVKDHFMRFGFVLDVYLPRDKNNKREHRGFGFVTFETEAAIQRVVAHGAHHIRGSIVAIDSAVPRQEEVLLAIDGHNGMGAGPALSSADQETANAIHAIEAMSLEGSGRGRALLRPPLSAAAVGMAQHY